MHYEKNDLCKSKIVSLCAPAFANANNACKKTVTTDCSKIKFKKERDMCVLDGNHNCTSVVAPSAQKICSDSEKSKCQQVSDAATRPLLNQQDLELKAIAEKKKFCLGDKSSCETSKLACMRK